MAHIIEKNKAVNLRKKGKSLDEISNILSMPKSTISVWCRNIRMGKKQIERLVQRQKSGSYRGRLHFLEKIRRERLIQTENLRKDGLSEIGGINKRDLFVAGIAFYISEGATSHCNEEVSFTNADPETVLFIKKWFEEVCKILKDRFVVQIRINKLHKDRTKEIENYWSKLLEVPLSQFTKTILIKSVSKKVYPKNSIYYGTVRLRIKQATQLRRKINGWVEGLLKI